MPNLDKQEVNCIVSNEGCELYVETAGRVYSVIVTRPMWIVEYRVNNSPVEALPNTPKTRILLDKFEQARDYMVYLCAADRMAVINGHYSTIQSILRED